MCVRHNNYIFSKKNKLVTKIKVNTGHNTAMTILKSDFLVFYS